MRQLTGTYQLSAVPPKLPASLHAGSETWAAAVAAARAPGQWSARAEDARAAARLGAADAPVVVGLLRRVTWGAHDGSITFGLAAVTAARHRGARDTLPRRPGAAPLQGFQASFPRARVHDGRHAAGQPPQVAARRRRMRRLPARQPQRGPTGLRMDRGPRGAACRGPRRRRHRLLPHPHRRRAGRAGQRWAGAPGLPAARSAAGAAAGPRPRGARLKGRGNRTQKTNKQGQWVRGASAAAAGARRRDSATPKACPWSQLKRPGAASDEWPAPRPNRARGPPPSPEPPHLNPEETAVAANARVGALG